ncbi:M28 family peptidase [Porphyrobacter sp. AAP82]|uniref:M28 family peptidase n=1 Tax=Porphyrobacter sp. AAP82 TaxID=1248917 RepID=UPI000315A5D9|nr:M28 family peptidase [Porphyrobacter sp. AAP82]
MNLSRGLALLLLALLAACAPRGPASVSAPVEDRAAIAARLGSDIAFLASDAMGGRRPGTQGARDSYAWIEKRMGEAGLVSGTNDPGSYWRLPVDLLGVQPETAQLVLGQGKRRVVVPAAEAAVYTPRRRALAFGGPGTGVPVVFVGYGDGSVLGDALAGAVVVMLADPGRDTERRNALFRQRATAVLTVVPDAEALGAVRALADHPRLQLASEEQDNLAAYITDKAFAEVIGPRRWASWKAEAAQGAFAPLELNLAVSLEATSDRREFASQNIVGMIPGSVPGSGAGLVLAHWDHLGECGEPDAPDRICNGAADNASGIAMLLELARRLKAGPPPGRDIYFLATTAEEPGLLGIRAFVKNPPLPLASIVAAFNLDMMAVAPAGSPVGFIGRGKDAGLDEVVLGAMGNRGRTLGDQSLADSFVQRQDGWALVQAGVPAVLLSSTYGSRAILDPFIAGRYHRPSDEADAVELGGAIDDLLLHEDLIRQIADPARYPAKASPRP